MKVYKFVVRKTLKNEVDIRAKDYKKALEKLIEFLGEDEDIVFNNLEDNDNVFEIKLVQVANNFEEEKQEFFEKKLQEIAEKIDDEIEDDLPREFTEIVCEKCGNCIPID